MSNQGEVEMRESQLLEKFEFVDKLVYSLRFFSF